MILNTIAALMTRALSWHGPASGLASSAPRAALCDAEVWVGPVSGAARCELEPGHGKWHRSVDAGWEWSEGQLWPLPHRVA